MTKKIISFLIGCTMLFSSIPVYAIPYDEYMAQRQEYMSASYEISPGLTYTEALTKNEKYGYERAYIYEYTPDMGTQIIPSCGDYVYGTESLGTLTKRLEEEGKRVVGGINGDFYSTSTGVPIGAMIIDGEIITSDNDRTAMGFDENGNAFISKPEIVTKLSNNDGVEINIEHINKYPLEYSLYLLTDKFYPTTKTSKASAEIVLMPYSDVATYMTEDEMPTIEEKTENKTVEESIEKSEEETDTEEKDGEEKKDRYVYIYPSDERTLSDESLKSEETEALEETEVSEEPEEPRETDEPLETKETEEPNSNEEHQESEETDVPEDLSENTEEKPSYFAKRYTFSDEKLKIGSDIKVVVTEIRKDSINSKIPEGCFVLCAENEFQLDRIKDIYLGCELEISVTANEQWQGAVNAIGNSGGLILKDGEYCDDVEIDHYPYAHPRTAAGITADGRVIFYCVDGRQKQSSGLRIDQLSHEMKELGCVIAMNLDGGGSTTAYAALPGDEFSTLKNSPSVNPERKTANSLLFVNTTEKLGEIERYTIFPENPYVLAGGSKYILSAPVATDINFHPVDLPEKTEYEYYTSADETDSVIIDGNIFVSGEKSGKCSIYLKVSDGENEKHFEAGHVFVLETPEDFFLGGEEYTISPFETVKFNFDAIYHTAEFFYEKESLRWYFPDETEIAEDDKAETDYEIQEEVKPDISPDEEIPEEEITEEEITGESTEENTEENIEENGDESAEEDIINEKYISVASETGFENERFYMSPELEITPKVHGETFFIKAKIGQIVKEIKINVEKFPFADSFTHWSAKNLYDVHSYGLMKGEEGEDGFAFFPQRNLTKAEFITVLSRILYPDIDKPVGEENISVPESEETAQAVQDAEITEEAERFSDNGTKESSKAEQAEEPEKVQEAEEAAEEIEKVPVTEEEEFPETVEEKPSFADWDEIPEWALKYFEAICESGLLDLVAKTDENSNKFIKAGENISREEVLILLGALSDEAKEDFVSSFTDAEQLYMSPNVSFINNALSAGIFEGYEDGSIRADNDLTRAEAATVIMRFVDNSATE